MKTKQLLLSAVVALGFATVNMAQTLPSYVPANGLVGWWPFNGNAVDESINTNDGAVNGATLTADRFGNASKAYSFDGVNDFISMSSMTNIPTGNNARTLSVWMKPSNLWNQWTLTAIGYGSPSTNNAFMFGLGNNIIAVQGWANDFSAPLIYTIGQWLHAVCTYDGLNIKIYVNNNLIGNGINSTWNTSGTEFYFGARPSQGNGFFPGNMDDIGIWNRALTQQEITALYNGANVGLNELSNTTMCSVYPNPASNKLTIKANEQIIGLPYVIYDNTCKVVSSDKLNSENTVINIENLAAGIYMLRVGNDIKQSFKVIKE